MEMEITLDPTNRIVLTKAVRDAAGITPGTKLTLSASPGVIIIGPEPQRARIVKKGKLKVLYGKPPINSVEDDVNRSRR